jgi:hypothetical protein
MEKLLHYLVGFLIGNEKEPEIINLIGYTSDESIFGQYKIVILPSGFFDRNKYGTSESLPPLPLKTIDNNIPILFGNPIVEKKQDVLIVHADIIASAYFLLSRYEEWIRPECRDEYGRFPGKESLAYRANFIHRPIVDEYGKLLQKWLKEMGLTITPLPVRFNKIYLTHDVDIPFLYRTPKNIGRTLLKEKGNFKNALKIFGGNIEDDPFFTFPWLLEQNKKLKAETIFFIKSTVKSCSFDKPQYNLSSKDIQYLLKIITRAEAEIGLHCSYLSGDNPALIEKEKKKLEQYSGKKIGYNRNHYLRSKEPQDMQYLIEAGITDDFTMGFADVSGFRLGTCRAIKWINVTTKEISTLTLHPLTIMECTLDRPQYMNLDYESALAYCQQLIDQTVMFHGDLTLLWHNTSVVKSADNWQRMLYKKLLNYINEK